MMFDAFIAKVEDTLILIMYCPGGGTPEFAAEAEILANLIITTRYMYS